MTMSGGNGVGISIKKSKSYPLINLITDSPALALGVDKNDSKA